MKRINCELIILSESISSKQALCSGEKVENVLKVQLCKSWCGICGPVRRMCTSIACMAGVGKGRGIELGRETKREGGAPHALSRAQIPPSPSPSLPLLTPATQASTSLANGAHSAYYGYEGFNICKRLFYVSAKLWISWQACYFKKMMDLPAWLIEIKIDIVISSFLKH